MYFTPVLELKLAFQIAPKYIVNQSEQNESTLQIISNIKIN
jgi:hypothetical protein